ncbi:MAG: phenylalanine--tRNA ligase subunit alpha [Nitrososphaeria archaeon]
MKLVLHPIEVEILKALKTKGNINLEALTVVTGLSLDQVRRGIEWLKEKNLVNVREDVKSLVGLGELGVKAAHEGLPERRVYDLVAEKGTKVALEEVKKESGMDGKEFSAALGLAIKKGLVKLLKLDKTSYLEAGCHRILSTESLINKISSHKEVDVGELSEEELDALKELERRPDYIVFKKVRKTMITASHQAMFILDEYLKGSYEDRLTSELLLTGKWRDVSFRPYDVESSVPRLYPGKKHPVQDFIDRVREIFLNFGFEEIEGPIILPSFWNFDALFIPQDHSAREMQDTFHIKGMQAKEIEKTAPLDVIKRVHEDGGETGSIGWKYRWSVQEAEKMVLRTHTTPITVQYLHRNKPSSAKVFSVDRVFRNENLDNRHLFEFYQYEGIVTGRNVTLRHLIGVLSSFYRELGFEKIKFWPTFFPYTEPSLEAVAYVERLGRWIELCGMGVFRPEVTLPAGVKNPVLAWGGGLERLILLAYNVEDIRFLYKNMLDWLRGVRYARAEY